jgi:streptogramin lyase
MISQRVFAIAFVGLVALLAPAAASGTQRFQRFFLPGPGPDEARPVQGPEGDVWVGRGEALMRVASTGSVYVRPTPGLRPNAIAVGPSGSLWFVDPGRQRVARLDAAGSLTVFSDGIDQLDFGTMLTLGADGAMWLTEPVASRIVRITWDGGVTAFPIPGLEPSSIVTGPDGNLWFTATGVQPGEDRVGRLTPSGQLATFELNAGDLPPGNGIAVGPDGNLWVATFGPLARVGIDGHIDYLRAGGGGSVSVATGADGNIWYTTFRWVGRMSPVGTRRAHFDVSFGHTLDGRCMAFSGPSGLAFAGDGTAWTSAFEDGAIERLAAPSLPPGPIRPLIAAKGPMRHITSLVRGRDGSAWIGSRGAIIRVRRTGRRALFTAGLGRFAPLLAPSADGAVWFTYRRGIGRLSETGRVRRFSIGRGIGPLAPGRRDTVWFVDKRRRAVGVMTQFGVVRRFSLGAHARPNVVALGRHGEHWVTDERATIYRISASGAVRRFRLSGKGDATGITLGGDGNMWFTRLGPHRVGRIMPDGEVRQFTVVAGSPAAITRGPDGALWFNTATAVNDQGDGVGGGLGRITYDGQIEQFPIRPTCQVSPLGLATGPDGRLWFAELNGPIAIAEFDPYRLRESHTIDRP